MLPRALCLIVILSLLTPAFAKDKFSQPRPIQLDRDGEKWAQKTLHNLSLEEKVGQLFMIWVRAEFLNVNSPEYLQLRDSLNKYRVGSFAMTVRAEGPFLYRNQPYEAAVLLNRLQQDSKLPLLIAADFERGVSMRLYGATVFPHAMAFGAAGKLDYAEAFGRTTAQDARATGVHWNDFAGDRKRSAQDATRIQGACRHRCSRHGRTHSPLRREHRPSRGRCIQSRKRSLVDSR